MAGHALKLEEELEHTKRIQGETTDRLVSRSADVESVTRSMVSSLFYERVRVIYSECTIAWRKHFSFLNDFIDASLCQLIKVQNVMVDGLVSTFVITQFTAQHLFVYK